MIGVILGTSEGKKILSLLNQYTTNIWVSTATFYGGSLLGEGSFKSINTKPLDLFQLITCLEQEKVQVLIDASHPYATEISKNAVEACTRLGVQYMRYERPSVIETYEGEDIVKIPNYEALYPHLNEIEGTIFNTTGSRNIEKLLSLRLKNRIVHRILPSVEVLQKCFTLGVKVEDIIALKGPVSYEVNYSLFKEYGAKAVLLKDSGVQGGTQEKVQAARALKIPVFVIQRQEISDKKTFDSEEEIVRVLVEEFPHSL